jgi:hypothetical protein
VKVLEGDGRGPIDVLSRHLIRGTEENHTKLRISGDPVEIAAEHAQQGRQMAEYGTQRAKRIGKMK